MKSWIPIVLTGLIFHGLLTVPLICSITFFEDYNYNECLNHEHNFTISDHNLILTSDVNIKFTLYNKEQHAWTLNFTKDDIYVSQFLLLNKTNQKYVKMSIYREVVPYNCYSQQCLIFTDYSIYMAFYATYLLAFYIVYLTFF